MCILGQAIQHKDSLFYNEDIQDHTPVLINRSERHVLSSMKAVVCANLPTARKDEACRENCVQAPIEGIQPTHAMVSSRTSAQTSSRKSAQKYATSNENYAQAPPVAAQVNDSYDESNVLASVDGLLLSVKTKLDKQSSREGSSSYGKKPKYERSTTQGRKHGRSEDPERLWHLRLGQPLSLRGVRRYISLSILPHATCRTVYCGCCLKGKQRRTFSGTLTSDHNISRIHCDTKGQVSFKSDDGHKYFLTVIE